MQTRNAIARDLLHPLPRGAFALGSGEALDAFLRTTSLPEMTTVDGWQDYRQHCREMVDALALRWPSDEKEYLPIGSGFIEVSEGADATVRGMWDLYDNLLANEPDTPLKLTELNATVHISVPQDRKLSLILAA
ncbi:hypothetical protein JQX09_23870 [Sulfitobacter pseudonitzschiae]|uniref:Uncharacterized protein n=1 Tax=Pseudosulfitobacter pseudonitzschiae TaxID=1402135 RepID=A0A9Q2NQH7_9RHOB|nr:hypothetical protein [Pseudosulfitobacter pseudonitzschiae]MBM2294969.1 hypothetical protein [Pseudosulfitobacter pseudonitzschiae]MBM2299884.1 hypothetical protein [Pseudosulfitobacter pseudonitzschiae]MBM2304807.1 hypothetical protein [Pseudosulfitobacter pseudonitzschiae]MBM2314580.1 hypothetical protein [Pseudosulfitobacter pseudonitzschiae]MBM2319490.1 hypothetical protein [Pseudosulfitobacter pseudonitzschiae]